MILNNAAKIIAQKNGMPAKKTQNVNQYWNNVKKNVEKTKAVGRLA